MSRRERWLLVGLAAALAVAVGLSAWSFAKSLDTSTAAQQTASRVAVDELQTCLIQQRGLPASHIQTRINRDLGLLLKVIPPARRHATRLQRFDRRIAIALGRNARRYARIEGHQPKTRNC